MGVDAMRIVALAARKGSATIDPVEALLKRSIALYTFLALGAFLAVAPWTPVWYEATLLLLPTRFGLPAQANSVRALVSGLGLLDLLVAFAMAGEMLQFSRGRKKKNGD